MPHNSVKPAALKRILVGVDFSAASDKAVAEATCLARHLKAELRLAHAVKVPEVPPAVFAGSQNATAVWEKGLRDHFAANRTRIDVMAKECAKSEIRVSHMLAEGYPDTALIDVTYQRNTDLLVIGPGGKAKKPRLGGTASRILRSAPCPVLIARAGKQAEGGYRRILVPSDFSEMALHALQTALAVAAAGAEIEIIHAYVAKPFAFPYFGPVPAPKRPATSPKEFAAELAQEADRLGQDIIAQCPSDRAALSYRTIIDTPINAITARLKDGKFDAVILGSHGRRGVRRWVLGSVAEAIADSTKCSVLIAHHSSGDQNP